MKSKFSQRQFPLILVLSIFLFFNSCQQEEVIENTQSESNLTFETIKFEQLEKRHKSFIAGFNDNGLTFSKSSNNNILIDSTSAIHIGNGDMNSYTFSVIGDTEYNHLKNVLISEDIAGNVEYFLIDYTIEVRLDEINEASLDNHIINTEVYSIDPSSIIAAKISQGLNKCGSQCWNVSNYTVGYCDDANGNTQIDNGQLGNGCHQNWHTETFTTVNIDLDCLEQACGGNTSGGTSDGGNNGPPNNGGPGGPGPGNGGGEPIITTPSFPDGTSAVPGFLINSFGPEFQLSTAQEVWINDDSNEIEVSFLLNFILQNNNTEGRTFALELLDVLRAETEKDFNALNFISVAYTQDKIFNAFDLEFFLTVNQYMDIDMSSTTDLTDPVYIHYITKVAVLKTLNPEWSNVKVLYEATKDVIHIALDIFGVVPVVGEVADLVNGVLYSIEGDGVNAALSFAATIPFVGIGSTLTKYGLKITNTVTGQVTKLVWKVTANGIEFGRRGQLRKILGLAAGNALQAHHIIPWAKRTSEIIQQAARSGNAFHMNEALNGIAVAAWRNQPNHNLYNDRVQALFDALPSNLSPDEAYDALTNIISTIRNTILSNPNTHLNDLIF